MNAKKLIALLLALVLCVGTLAACNSDPKETTQATTKATEGTTAATTAATTEATEPAPLTNAERYPIDFDGTLTCVSGNAKAAELVFWQNWETWTGVDVEWITTAKEQTPLLFLDEKNMPDMFFQASGVSVAQVNEYGQSGLLINYMDYLDKLPNIAARYAEDPMLFDAVKDAEGNVYTLTYYCDTMTMPSNLFYVRTDMTKKAGIEELPTTVEGFLEMCATLKEYYKDVEGYVPMASNGAASMAYNNAYSNFFFPAFGELMQAGITTNADWTEIEVGFATEQFKNYISFMHTLYAEGYMDPDCFVNESATTKAMTNEGKVTMHPHATQLSKDHFESGELDFQVMPAMTSQYQSEARWALPNNYIQGCYMISSTCSDLDAALAFMDALYSVQEDPLNEEGTVWGLSIWIGEMGVNFTVDEESGKYVNLVPEGYDAATWSAAKGSGSGAYLAWPYVEDSGTGLMKKAEGYQKILRPDGVKILYTTLLKLTEDEQETYNDVWTDINNKVTEMNAAFITGQADIEAEWDNYIKSLYDMGLQDVIDVYQAALDRYNAAK